MKELLENKELTLNYIPNHGAWTYNIIIPDSKDIKGKWGYIKVSGTIDGYEFKNMNLAPRKGLDMYMSVNADIRKAINKKGGDTVVVTMQKDSDNKLTDEHDIIECFKDAEILTKFKSLDEEERTSIIKDILSQNDENSQEKKILLAIKKLSSKPDGKR
ncbi:MULTISPECIES: DUF1905 domain-containing protein [Pedobacter]|uniref:DUF1905 domain-containing protein n=1 Tax=Pedobacter TaxID=84567 RepID=UPI0011FA4D7E|nr:MULTISPECIES: DUF1905 domain-containing protein [Pedobacter]RZJ90553.1 MAG: DUF1905 domain-containing protein [Chryseobacterium sp.]